MKVWVKVSIILLAFGAGVWVGAFVDGNESEAEQKAKIRNLEHTIVTKIKFTDEDKRDFIEEQAQFSISPNGEINSLKGEEAVLMLQHDKEDWDWYNAAIITDKHIIEEYKVDYGEHRKTGFPAESIFDK
jgi:hypothetical protein